MKRLRLVVLLAAVSLASTVLAGSASAAPAPSSSTSDRSISDILAARGLPELSETTRLADRRSLVTGDRLFAMGDTSGRYPASGWHVRGEMGGFWTPPVKLLDGMWFAVDGEWLGDDESFRTTRYTSGWGYQRFDYQARDGVRVERVDFVPDGMRASLIGLSLRSDSPRTVRLAMDAHSELMPSYPWDWTTPSSDEVNLPDTSEYTGGSLTFRESGESPGLGAHDYAAVVGGSLEPSGHHLGPDHRGPQDPAVICPAEGDVPMRCDDSATGKGTGGRLDYELELHPSRPTVVWFAVAGSDQGVAEARAEYRRALENPVRLLLSKARARADAARNTVVDMPGDPLLERSVAWSKQNLADSVQEAHDLALRDVDEGSAYPEAKGTLERARWFGAGFPDYPWLFGTDGEYTAFAAVAAGQFDPIKAHLRALRDVSEVVNDGSGKVVHEVMSTGDVYFGANHQPGNTDETVKFPSAVALVWRWTGDDRFRDEMYDFAVRNLRYVSSELDADGDGWPEGLGNVEREGMGEEKLDSTVYLIRGLLDLADMADSKGDTRTERWARAWAADLRDRFDRQWWMGNDANAFAESIDDPDDPANDNTRIFQRHWTGVTPMEVELPGPVPGPLATGEHGDIALDQRERACYTGEFGLYHTGSGPTSAPEGNPGPSCDSVVSTVKSERSTYSLNTAVMAVAEGNYGRLGPDQQGYYIRSNARLQLDPSVWETPGAMPEVAPSPDFQPNIDRPFTDRSMSLQAWGTYGVLWPVVHQQFGVSPDLGRSRLSVVPQLPDGQRGISGESIRLGGGMVDVSVTRAGKRLSATVDTDHLAAGLTLGVVLPDGTSAKRVLLDGERVDYTVVHTARGTEIHVAVHSRGGRLTVVVS